MRIDKAMKKVRTREKKGKAGGRKKERRQGRKERNRKGRKEGKKGKKKPRKEENKEERKPEGKKKQNYIRYIHLSINIVNEAFPARNFCTIIIFSSLAEALSR